MTKTSAVEFPEKLSADGVIDIQERLGNGHKRLSVDEADGEACIVCRFGRIILVLIFVLLSPDSHLPCIRSMLGVNVLGICSPCQMFLSDSVEESSQDTITCMRGSDCQVVRDIVVVALFVVAFATKALY